MSNLMPWRALTGEVLATDDDGCPSHILVGSDSSPDSYTVARSIIRIEDEGTQEESFIRKWSCTCKAYEYGEGKACKHIKRAVPAEFIPDVSALTGHE